MSRKLIFETLAESPEKDIFLDFHLLKKLELLGIQREILVKT